MRRLRFLHIPKTAGTSFQYVLNRIYKKGEIFNLETNNIEKFKSLPIEKQNKIKCFVGHTYLKTGIPEADNAITFTLFRDPISRVKSFCQHVSEGKSPYLVNDVPPDSFNLDKFLESGNNELSNLQTKFLVGTVGESSVAENLSESQIFDLAINNIDTKVDCFGIQEHFDISLILFSGVLHWGFPFYPRVNKKKTNKLIKFNEHHIERISELNALDIKVYNYAKKKFMSYVNSPEFNNQKLGTFRKYQSIVSPIINSSAVSQRWLRVNLQGSMVERFYKSYLKNK